MDKLVEVLKSVNDSIDYENESHLIDDGLLDSLSILSLVVEIESEFDIEISPLDLVPTNFNSLPSLWAMIQRLQS